MTNFELSKNVFTILLIIKKIGGGGGGGGGGGAWTFFEYLDLLTMAQKLLQKLFNIWNNDIAAASDHAALRVSVMQCRLGVILPTVKHR